MSTKLNNSVHHISNEICHVFYNDDQLVFTFTYFVYQLNAFFQVRKSIAKLGLVARFLIDSALFVHEQIECYGLFRRFLLLIVVAHCLPFGQYEVTLQLFIYFILLIINCNVGINVYLIFLNAECTKRFPQSRRLFFFICTFALTLLLK